MQHIPTQPHFLMFFASLRHFSHLFKTAQNLSVIFFALGHFYMTEKGIITELTQFF